MTLWKTPDGVSLDTLAEEATVADLVEALDGEVLKDATIRDKRGRYRNGDFLVVRLEDT